ncbi:MAG: hypothetical protein WCE65_00990, partial [Methanoregula sp.]
MKRKYSIPLTVLLVFVIACIAIQPVLGSSIPGTVPGTATIAKSNAVRFHSLTAPSSGLTPMVTVIGKVNLSVGGIGTVAENGPIRVWKMPGETVLAAFMSSATTPGSSETPGIVQIDGQPVFFTNNVEGNFGCQNYWGNVTSLVKSKFDSAPAGTVSFDINEGAQTYSIDGEALYIIANDPSQTADNTVIIEWGALDALGDQFNIGLANPINKTLPNFGIQLGLTDTFSYQLSSAQYSIINVSTNSLPQQRLTTWAGGEDNELNHDESDGALFTVGGYNDTV